MRRWDLTTGAAKLELAGESLRKAMIEATTHWDDQTNRNFQEKYLEPMRPKLRRAIDAVHRLQLVLAKAERECGSD